MPACTWNELPQARGMGSRISRRVVGAFYEGQQGQFGGQAPAVELVDNMVQILAGTLAHEQDGFRMRGVVIGPAFGQFAVQVGNGEATTRPEERRGGKGWVSPGRNRW